jgi:tripartite-type tricarboxylate transporter receptor subunit TctC
MRALIRVLPFSLFALAQIGGPVSAADGFPSKPIKIVVPFPAGATGDLNARQLAPFLSERLKQSIIVENRPGAGGLIGSEAASRASPDGHTVLFMVSATLTVAPHLQKSPSFDPVRDLRPFIVTVRSGTILVVNAKSSIRSFSDLIAAAKAKPGALTYASSGPGSMQHLMGERLKQMAGIDLLHVPYKGETPSLTDLIGGQVDLVFGFALATLPHIRSGKLRPLAVTTAKRLSSLPDVPTIAESGFPGYDERVWAGFAVPAGTPQPIVDKLHAAFHASASLPQYRQAVEGRGSEPVASTQEEAVQLLKGDHERYARIVKELDLRLE